MFVMLVIYLQEAVFKKEVEHLSKKSRKNTLKVEKGFYTKENMRKVLGWNAKLVGIILCSTCSVFSHAAALCPVDPLLPPFPICQPAHSGSESRMRSGTAL